MASTDKVSTCAIERQTEPNQEEIDEKPWKYLGYHSFSRFLASDNDFFILRKFSTLNVRVLIRLQDRLAQVEEELEKLEQKLRRKNAQDVHNGSFRQDPIAERTRLIDDAHQLLRQYNKLVLQYSEIKARPKAPLKDVRSVDNWLYNNDTAVNLPETDFVNHRSDLFSVVATSKSPLRKLLEKSQWFRLLKLWRPSLKDGSDLTPKDENIHYASDKRIERFIASINTVLGIAMLIAPLWILAFLKDLLPKLAVISAFIILFLVAVSVVTVANMYESLAATAAYSAVLMVFLQVSGGK